MCRFLTRKLNNEEFYLLVILILTLQTCNFLPPYCRNVLGFRLEHHRDRCVPKCTFSSSLPNIQLKWNLPFHKCQLEITKHKTTWWNCSHSFFCVWQTVWKYACRAENFSMVPCDNLRMIPAHYLGSFENTTLCFCINAGPNTNSWNVFLFVSPHSSRAKP